MSIARPALLALLVLVLPVVFLAWRRRRGGSAAMRAVALGVRTVGLCAVVAALAEPRLGGLEPGRTVVFAIDTSSSMTPGQQAWARDWVARAVGTLPPGGRATLLDFAATPQLVAAGAPGQSGRADDRPGDPPAGPAPSSDTTDIPAALRLAGTLATTLAQAGAPGTLGASPPAAVVLLTDGWNTAGQGPGAPLDAPEGVPVSYVVPPVADDGPTAVLRGLDVPANVRVGESPDVAADVQAVAPATAHLRLTVDDAVVSDDDLQLQVGANRVSFSPRIDAAGFHQLDAVLTTGERTSHLSAVTVAHEPGRLLLLEDEPGAADQVAALLGAAGFAVERRPAASIPPTPTDLAPFDAALLVDTPATSLTLDQQRTLQAFVQDLGRGLVLIGGPHSFAPGGYEGTTLDELAPLSSAPPVEPQLGTVALFLVIDRSGSMDLLAGSQPKIAMAREAAMRAAELLQPNDQLGVIAFDSTYQWIVPPARITGPDDVLRAKSRIDSIKAGGGTSILPPLQAALEAAASADAPLKHVVLMTDGESDDRGYEQLLARMQPQHVTLSTLAIGSDADRNLLATLARLGGGRSYFTERSTLIPQIAAKETTILTRNAVIEGQAAVRAADPSPIVRLLSGSFPTLGGYVATTRKPRAVTALESQRGHPLLAHWQYGLGRVVAWTSEAQRGWATAWTTWPEASQFWAQVVRWALPAPQQSQLQVTARVLADGRRVTVQAQSVRDDGRFDDLLDTRATILAPDGTARELPMVQRAPGLYELTTTVGLPGVYRVLVAQRGPGGQTRQELAGFAAPDSPELHTLGTNSAQLADLAARSGGRELRRPEEVAAQAGTGAAGPGKELWPWLLAAALVLLPVDVYVRRRL
jgi:Ca-activated chloride channel homolog